MNVRTYSNDFRPENGKTSITRHHEDSIAKPSGDGAHISQQGVLSEGGIIVESIDLCSTGAIRANTAGMTEMVSARSFQRAWR